MASRLKVDELRAQLSQRGLETSGTKPVLVERLESALEKEEKEKLSTDDTTKKRPRESEDDESDVPEKKKVVQAVQEMGIRELREQAKVRGISAGGSKKDIIERLSADLQENLEVIPEAKEEEDESVKEKLHEQEIEKLREMSIAQLREQAKIRGVSAGGSKKEIIERLCADLQEVPKEVPKVKEEEDESVKEKLREQEIEKLREMSIAQLREQAKIRGVSAGGSKKDIIERLCADLQEVPEEVPKVKEEVDGGVKEKSREEEIARLHEMDVRQLREEATLRGISTSGSKKELLERICSDLQGDKKEIPKDKEVSEKLKEKIVTATKKGGAVLDQYLPDHIKTQYHVLRDGDEFYDAMLNQTNVGDNNNKFYMIQALESDGGGTFMVYNRWGRVGVKGQDKLHGPYTSRDSAIQEFELKFSAKTKNQWSDRKDFVYHPKCYTWLEMDYSEAGEESKVPEKLNDTTMVAQPRETQLEPRIAEFISLICNVSMMKQQMLEIGYNAEKLPLGKLSKSTILKGYGVLKRIADVIDRSDKRALIEQLSGEFYTVIPHDFGFKKMWEFIIDTPVKLKLKLEMVEALGEIELATKLLKDDNEIPGDPFFSHYKRLGCELAPVDVDSREYSMVMRYMQNTHAKTHSGYTVDIIQLFRVSRPGETERFTKFANTKNRALLWHGSRLTNWTGILSQGLRIAPPEAPSTGYMFGKGVYFADMFSKSANYCYSSSASRAGVLLLCEVALGEMAELLNANYDADKLPAGKLSTKGVGTTAPDPSEYEALDDGVVVPLGKPKEQMSSRGSLLYNEYIVYNVDQIRMRYLVQVNFNYKRY